MRLGLLLIVILTYVVHEPIQNNDCGPFPERLGIRTLSSRGEQIGGCSWTSMFGRRPTNTDLRKVANYVMLHKAWGLDELLEWPSPVAKQRRRESYHSLLSASVRPTEVIESLYPPVVNI